MLGLIGDRVIVGARGGAIRAIGGSEIVPWGGLDMKRLPQPWKTGLNNANWRAIEMRRDHQGQRTREKGVVSRLDVLHYVSLAVQHREPS